MKVFKIANESMKKTPFAKLTGLSNWSSGVLCPDCGRSTEIQLEPMTLEWDLSTGGIPDFALDIFVLAVQNSVRKFFEKNSFDFSYGKAISTTKSTARPQRIQPPPRIPKFSWAIPCKHVWPDYRRSGASVDRWCNRCNRIYYTWGDELIIEKSTWSGEKVFCVAHWGSRAFITEEGVEEVLLQRFEGFSYIPVGFIK